MLDHKKMLKEINNLVQTDFMFEMECNLLPNSKPYTQKEAKEMANLLTNVYMISHCLKCTACQAKYKLNN